MKKLIQPSLLRRKSLKINDIDDSIIDLAKGLSAIAQIYAGIAAPQLGCFQRIIAVNFNGIPMVMVNPEIMSIDEEEQINLEGCMSFPKINLFVPRPTKAVIKYTDLEGNDDEAATLGIETAAVLHEIDHLNGILFVDRAVINHNERRKVKRMFKVTCLRGLSLGEYPIVGEQE